MKLHKHNYSLWRRISACLAIIYAALLILMFLNNIYAINTMRQRIYNQLYGMLDQEERQITSELNDVSTYLASYSLKAPNFSIVERNKQDSEYYSALYKLKTELRNSLTSMSIIQGLFVFPTTSEQMVSAAKDAKAEASAGLLRTWIRTENQNQTLKEYIPKQWFALELDNRYYLLRFLKIGKSYVGAWTDFTYILSRFNYFKEIQCIPLFASNSQEIYNIDSYKVDYNLDASHANDGMQFVTLDEPYFTVSLDTDSTWNGALYLLVPTRQISSELKNSYLFTMITSAFFILLAVATILLLRRYLLQPILALKDSLLSLRNGDFTTRIDDKYTCDEFIDVNNAFNQMVERIEDLKINIYEEQLLQQQTQMLALKNQIAPHFLINCLNAIYHMTATGDNENIRHMTVYLGEHLRYALADTATVTLGEELEKVENYIKLFLLRFPNSIELIMDVDDTLKQTTVLPMIILFQVENIIKYEVVNGELTQIHLEIMCILKDLNSYIHICIWDTGRGYRPDVLRQLCSQKMLSQSDGHNIGTKNIYQRLHLMFKNDFSMKFSNRPGAGAQVNIEIPVRLPEGKDVEV